jgi:hypothetical protein
MLSFSVSTSDVGNPYFAAENTHYGIHVSVLYANTGVIRGGSGENTPRMAVSLPFFLHKHPQPIKRPQTCSRGVWIAPRTVMTMEGLAKTDVLFATSPQLVKNHVGAETQPKCKPLHKEGMSQELGQGYAVAGCFGGEGAPMHAHARVTRKLGQATTSRE